MGALVCGNKRKKLCVCAPQAAPLVAIIKENEFVTDGPIPNQFRQGLPTKPRLYHKQFTDSPPTQTLKPFQNCGHGIIFD